MEVETNRGQLKADERGTVLEISLKMVKEVWGQEESCKKHGGVGKRKTCCRKAWR